MNWESFSSRVCEENCSTEFSRDGKISELLSAGKQIHKTFQRKQECAPKGLKNGEIENGFHYVDMNCSYWGEAPIFVAEASCCMILVLVDAQSGRHFASHISASSDMKRLPWLSVKTDLQLFFKAVDYDVERVEQFIFSCTFYKNQPGSFEQKNVMNLLSSVLSQTQLEKLAEMTYLIQGENGLRWNPCCSVHLSSANSKNTLKVSLVS